MSAIGPSLGAVASSSSQPPNVNFWDPDSLLPSGRSPSKTCLARIKNDLKRLRDDPLPGIYVVADDRVVTRIHALICGPFSTPYEGGLFHFILDVPDDYPHSPPKAKLLTTDLGRCRFNPNLYANGKICLSILGTWQGPSWTATQSIGSVLISIQSLMGEHPMRNEPGFENAPPEKSEKYNDIIRHETLRVAVCGMLESESPMAKGLPAQMKDLMRTLFPSFLETYQTIIAENKDKDGRPFEDPFGERRNARFDYKTVEKRINKLAKEISSES